MKTQKFELSGGFVYGSLWDGSNGAYPVRKLYADTKNDLIKQATEGLDGSLDSGMGFQRLKGAILEIKTITTLLSNGKEYVNNEYETEFIGDLTEKESDFLFELMLNE